MIMSKQLKTQEPKDMRPARINLEIEDIKELIANGKRELKEQYDFKPIDVKQGEGLKIILGMTLKGVLEVNLTTDGVNLLIGAGTGSGKSLLLINILLQLLHNYSNKSCEIYISDAFDGLNYKSFQKIPNVKFVKKEELGDFLENIKEIVQERTDLFNAENEEIMDIEDYNRGRIKKLPYKVIMFDEMYHISTKSQEAKDIAEIGSKCRKCGIFLIIATQKTTTDRINSDITANFLIRVAMRVANQQESKNVLEDVGAELIDVQGRGILKGMGEFQGFYLTPTQIREECKKYKI